VRSCETPGLRGRTPGAARSPAPPGAPRGWPAARASTPAAPAARSPAPAGSPAAAAGSGSAAGGGERASGALRVCRRPSRVLWPEGSRRQRQEQRALGSGAVPIDRDEEEQPDHVDEVPVPGRRLEAEMVIRLEVARVGPEPADCQEDRADHDVEAMEAG